MQVQVLPSRPRYDAKCITSVIPQRKFLSGDKLSRSCAASANARAKTFHAMSGAALVDALMISLIAVRPDADAAERNMDSRVREGFSGSYRSPMEPGGTRP